VDPDATISCFLVLRSAGLSRMKCDEGPGTCPGNDEKCHRHSNNFWSFYMTKGVECITMSMMPEERKKKAALFQVYI
jgi:hypothetical protein